jgi:molecular chaperone Hsp33
LADKLIRGMAGKEARFFITDCTDLVKKASKLHNLSLGNAVVLGKLLCAGILVGANLKSEKDILTVKVDGDGPSGKAIVTVNDKSQIKGFISNSGADPESNTGRVYIDKAMLGNGSISIIKDMGLKEPYSGKTEMIYGNIAQDLTYYYVKSEQIPTSIGLGVLIFPDGSIKKAGGFIVQMMPGYNEKTVEIIENNLKSFPNLTDVLDMGYSLEHIIENMILKGLDIEFYNSSEPVYKCGCSRAKMKNVVKLLNKKEIEDSLKSPGFIEVNCHFCNRSYKFTRENLSK